MDDLIAFLRARLDDDEHAAHDACEYADKEWRVDELGETLLLWNPMPDGPTGHTIHWRVTPHIANHDPARVLAEVDAKRKLIDAYEKVVFEQKVRGNYPGEDLVSMQRALRHAIKILALPHADHPDYRSSWRA